MVTLRSILVDLINYSVINDDFLDREKTELLAQEYAKKIVEFIIKRVKANLYETK